MSQVRYENENGSLGWWQWDIWGPLTAAQTPGVPTTGLKIRHDQHGIIKRDKHSLKKAILKGQASLLTKPPRSQLISCPIFSRLVHDFASPASPQKEHEEIKGSKTWNNNLGRCWNRLVCWVLLRANVLLTEAAVLNTFPKKHAQSYHNKDPIT